MERFRSKVDQRGSFECWPWLGAVDKDGYGQFKRDGRQHKAPRIAMELDGRGLTSDQITLHSCDNPSCCNPAHLRPGTHKENAADKVSRHRQSAGEKHGMAKLSAADVADIRRLLADSQASKVALAAEYGVSDVLIGKIWRRDLWQQVAK